MNFNSLKKDIDIARVDLESARLNLKEAKRKYKNLLLTETRWRIAEAKKNSEFKIGDIISLRNNSLSKMLVTSVYCGPNGNSEYKGIEVKDGKLTGIVKTTPPRTKDRVWEKSSDCVLVISDGVNPPARLAE